MIILDEDIMRHQREVLRSKRITTHQIGIDFGRSGMADEEVVTLLHGLKRATFFSRDAGYYRGRLMHRNYCLVYLDVVEQETARYVIRFLRHGEFRMRRKRMGTVVRVSPAKITFWKKRYKNETSVAW